MIAALAIHHPEPEHVDDWIEVMRQYAGAARDAPGLIDIVGYRDTGSNCLFGFSRWESEEVLAEVLPGAIEQASKLDEKWGEQPTDILVLKPI